jgi:DNA end-binding protein Ku
MPRALWKGAVSFGLVYVPVELHTASRDNTLPLHMLDSRDFASVGYHRINKKSGKEVAVATFVMHQRQHLCAIAPQGTSLMLLTLRFADEVLAPAAAKAAKINQAELAMAKQLVQSMSGRFTASRFKDTYRADLKRRVQEKIRKKETHSLGVDEPTKEKRPKAQVIDLMTALRASLGKDKRSVQAPPKSSKSRKRA